ncbi:MAG: hypothetical protein KAR57_04125, partial [Bacteroidales bacterium]|nr:hypothetical protein [Bacteroidales bacterium]
MTNNIGKAIFNLQRFQILQTKLNPQTSDLMPDHYAYAWYVKMFPLFNEVELHEDLEEYFTITKQQVDIISNRADSEWLEKRLYNFYEYESFFNCRTDPVEGIGRWT